MSSAAHTDPDLRNTRVMVVGAGTMGGQIAMTAALAGFPTILQDISAEGLTAAEHDLARWAKGRVGKQKLREEDASAALGRIEYAGDLSAAARADVVIEAATERLEIKRDIFAELGRICPPHTILVTNSSTLGSSKIAGESGRPDKVCNMHFFNPALVMKCVEVVRNDATSQQTVEAVMALARAFGKEPVLINREVPGFIANRLMGAVQREALALAEAGVASREDIDSTARTALGHPLGPFELMDLVGLDVIHFIAECTYAETGDTADKPNAAVAALVEQGRLGRKTGAGFYEYARAAAG